MTSATTICDAFAATVAAHAKPALRTPDGGIDWTSRAYAERVEPTARALAGRSATQKAGKHKAGKRPSRLGPSTPLLCPLDGK